MKKRLYLVRHGQTLYNIENRIQGRCDSPLTPAGHAQAKAAGKCLCHLQNPRLYASPSGRAQETMAEIARSLPVQNWKSEPGLQEVYFGSLEGKNGSGLPEPYTEFRRYFDPYGGEKAEDAARRLYETLVRMLEESSQQEVVAVSHGMVMCEFETAYAGTKLEDFCWENCAVHVFSYENGQFILEDVLRAHPQE